MTNLTVTQPAATGHALEPAGRAFVEGWQCVLGDVIRADDIVTVNFDRKHVHTGGGLYLVQSADGWRGCRRMMRVINGIAIDECGDGNWVTVTSLDDTVYGVVGTVEKVYRPTQY